MIEKYYTSQELERITGISARQWRRIARRVKGSKRLGRRVLLPERSIKELLDSAERIGMPRGQDTAYNGIVGRAERSQGKHKALWPVRFNR